MDEVDTVPLPDGDPGPADCRHTELAGVVETGLAALRAEMAREHERAAAREKIIDRLHDDNQTLRSGEHRLLLRPLLVDLQRLRHDMLRAGAGLPAEFSGDQAAALLRSYADNLELTLERGGIAVVTPEIGAAFDPSTQRATGTIPADDPDQDATVAAVVLDGYLDVQGGRTIVPAAVLVHRCAPALEALAIEPAHPIE